MTQIHDLAKLIPRISCQHSIFIASLASCASNYTRLGNVNLKCQSALRQLTGNYVHMLHSAINVHPTVVS